jgi:uncharacterized protein (TIGR02147 family)
MDLYNETDYKQVLREKIRECRQQDRRLNLKQMARKIPIQYTYLSKALNDEKTHLNEDHLFSLCHQLGLHPEEIEYVYLLRSLSITSSPARRDHLQAKRLRIRRSRKLNASIQGFDQSNLLKEIDYLLDAVSVVVHVSLDIPDIAKDPRRLCMALGIGPKRLQATLIKLSQLGLLELSENGNVVKVNKGHIHYAKDHPLMRSHQSLLKALCASRLLTLEESGKQSFMATFSADAESLKKIEAAFERFIEQVEKIAVTTSRREHTYQLNFDLFRWI